MTDTILKGGKTNMGQCMYASCCSGYSGRSFLTKEEKIEMLNDYKNELDQESKAVTERIDLLKKD